MLTIFSPTGIPDAPRRTENVVLLICSASFAALVIASALWLSTNLNDLGWDFTLVFAVGIWFATAVRLIQTAVNVDAILQTRSTEGLILGGVLLTSLCISAARWGGQIDAEGNVAVGPIPSAAAADVPRPDAPTKRWAIGLPSSGSIVPAPLIVEDRVYVAAAHPPADYGTLYCLNRATGEILWEFIDDGKLKKCFSAPVFANGKIYMGEGWHDSRECRVLCVEEFTNGEGKKEPRAVWTYQATSQIEATPLVKNKKVYVGGGNQGFLCLNSENGELIWQFDAGKARDPKLKGKLLRFGSGAAIVGERVFFGTGVDRFISRDQCETRIFCVREQDGGRLWDLPTELPCWGRPVAFGDHVFFALGTGDFAKDTVYDGERPAGALLCLTQDKGTKIWEFHADKGFLQAPAVDHHHVYVGGRDDKIYCLDRFHGEKRWEVDLGSPILATPQLVRSSTCDQTASVVAIASGGKICCLEPNTGAVQWTYDLTERDPFLGSLSVIAGHSVDGDRRQIFFGGALEQRGQLAGAAVVYCLEDLIRAR